MFSSELSQKTDFQSIFQIEEQKYQTKELTIVTNALKTRLTAGAAVVSTLPGIVWEAEMRASLDLTFIPRNSINRFYYFEKKSKHFEVRYCPELFFHHRVAALAQEIND